ncbi:hypothetical protein SteCoe_38209 [Stentor coeruleus]|uniref:Uncharacterized protein n=1 Tax=Stentor coeruleus TaxID=5963 RepID=A0A1R2ALQ4_9CILI|nr:hypothetical protein SteCoe_38209 [Stentor coeruleus]
MNTDDDFYSRNFMSNGQRLLKNFYAKRSSLSPIDYYEDQDLIKQKQHQNAVKVKLSEQYIKLLKENGYLREFIKKHHVRLNGNRIVSDLDFLKNKKTKSDLSKS